MNGIGILLALECVSCAVLFVILSVPLYQRSVKMNRWYGFRIRKSFSSEENWYKINRYGAKRLMLWSVPLLLIGVIAFFVPFDSVAEDLPLVLAFAVAPLIVFVPLVETCLYARKL